VLDRVVSGGQTGADQAGWRAARASGIATGGWMPAGFLTEAGPRPEFAEMFGAGGRLPRAGPGQCPRLGRVDLVRGPWVPRGPTTPGACTGFGRPVYAGSSPPFPRDFRDLTCGSWTAILGFLHGEESPA
jgi:hypothetical protein